MKPEFSFDKVGKVGKYALIGLAVGVVGTGIFTWLGGGLFYDPTGATAGEPFDEKRTIAAQNVNNLDILSSSTDVTLKMGSGDDVQVQLKGNGDREKIMKRYNFVVEQKGDTAHVEFRQKNGGFRFNFFRFPSASVDMEITVPKKMYESMQIDVSSGDVFVQDLGAEQFRIESNSGTLDLKNIESKKAELRVSSGEVNVRGLKSEELVAEASSGDLKLTDISGAVRLQTSSGRAELKMKELTKDINIQASSGDVTVYAPKSSSFAYEGVVSSGDINIDFPEGTIRSESKRHISGTVGSGGPQVFLEASSGDIELRSY